jgi:hypothetical protein
MVNYKILQLLVFSLIIIPFVNAQPPQTIIYSDAGIDIAFPHPDYLKQGEDFNITFWVYNSSNGAYLNLDLIDQCTFYLLDDKGSNILRLQTDDGIKYNRSIEVSGSCQNCYYSTILGGNISQSGIYPLQIKCVASDLGGYLTSGYEVTPTGIISSIGYYILILIFSLGIIVLGLWSRDAPITILGSFGLYFLGIYILFFGIVGVKDTTYTWAISIIILGLAFYVSVRSAHELITD